MFTAKQSSAEFSLGATNTFGEIPITNAMTNFANNSPVIIDQTVNDLRTGILWDLIKNPKIFKDEKDDIKKSIDDIEQLLKVAHISDSNRLELISYLLRGDTLE